MIAEQAPKFALGPFLEYQFNAAAASIAFRTGNIGLSHVRELTTPPGGGPWHGDTFRLRYAGPRNRAAPRARPAAIAPGRNDARSLGGFRRRRRLWLAQIRYCPEADDALRHDIQSRGRFYDRGARPGTR